MVSANNGFLIRRTHGDYFCFQDTTTLSGNKTTSNATSNHLSGLAVNDRGFLIGRPQFYPLPASGADTHGPTFAGVTSVDSTSSTSLTAHWSAAVDDVTSSANIIYKVYWSVTSGFINGAPDVGFAFTTAGATSYVITGLTPTTTYYVVVQALDESDNNDGNGVEISALTGTAPPATEFTGAPPRRSALKTRTSSPYGVGAYGVGTSPAAPVSGGKVNKNSAGKQLGSLKISLDRDTKGQYVFDSYGNRVGMPDAQQLTILALNEVRGKCIVKDLGNKFVDQGKVFENFKENQTQLINDALASLVQRKLITIDSIRVEPGDGHPSITWVRITDLTTNSPIEVPIVNG